MEKKVNVYILFILLVLFWNCQSQNDCDIITYQIPSIDNDISVKVDVENIKFCSINSNSIENEYYFSFFLGNMEYIPEKEKKILGSTNRMIIINNKPIPIFSIEDIYFSKIVLVDTMSYFNDFNSIVYKIDANGSIMNIYGNGH